MASPPGPSWERALPWLLALAFAGVYATLSVARFQRLATRSFDLGIYEQAVRAYSRLQPPIVDIEGPGNNFLGDHWDPAIAVFAPFYRLFPTPLTLLVGQAMVIALAVVPMTRAGIRRLGRWSGLAVGLAFGMSYGIQAAVDFDFHGVCLAVPLLAFGFEAYLTRRWTAVVAWTAPLVLVKEDLGLTVAAVGLVLALVGARRLGLGLAGFGLASFAVTMTLLIPHFNAQGRYPFWSGLASKPGTGDTVLNRIVNLPLDVLTPGPRATTLMLLLAVTAFMALRSPLLIVVMPTLAWRFVSTNESYWGQDFHYDLVLMPVVFAALVDGVIRARRSRLRPARWHARAAPALALLVGVFLCSRYPFMNLFAPATYQHNPRAAASERILAHIPDGARVETDIGLMARLTGRTQVYWIGGASPVIPEFVLMDAQAGGSPISDPLQYAGSLHPGVSYYIVDASDGYLLMRRVPQ